MRPWESREVKSSSEVPIADIKPKDFEGGSFSYHWPPGSETFILLDADLTTWTFTWTIILSPTSIYYPGSYVGSLSIPTNFPWGGAPDVQFLSPISCPYIVEGKMTPQGTWSLAYTSPVRFHHILTSIAAVLHYGPEYEKQELKGVVRMVELNSKGWQSEVLRQ
jgi:ubiquitin-protein ligase